MIHTSIILHFRIVPQLWILLDVKVSVKSLLVSKLQNASQNMLIFTFNIYFKYLTSGHLCFTHCVLLLFWLSA